MIAGYITPEAQDALQRMRERGTVRKHICRDEHQDHQRPIVPPTTAMPPKGKRALLLKPLEPTRPKLPDVWEMCCRGPTATKRRARRHVNGHGLTAKLRAALRTAPPEGMTTREIIAITQTGYETARLLGEMRDVETCRTDGRGRYRYRLGKPPPLVIPTLADWTAAKVKGRKR